jgi:two-component system, chemotaxis family, response regulator Rcp1
LVIEAGERSRWIDILHVEDNPAEAELLREALSRFPGLSVRTAQDGAAALAYLRDAAADGAARRPHLVLLDLNLPVVDGRRVLAQLKTDPALRAIPVIVFSSSTLHEDLILAYQLGANAFVVKPPSLAEYQLVVERLCAFWCQAAALPPQVGR